MTLHGLWLRFVTVRACISSVEDTGPVILGESLEDFLLRMVH